MPLKDDSRNDPPYGNDGVKVFFKNGSHTHYWYTSKIQRDKRLKDLKKKVKDPQSNIVEVEKAQRSL